jgi:hypothetical protein
MEISEQEQCRACGGRLTPDAAWCGQCFAPATAVSTPVGRAQPLGTGAPVEPRRSSRWRGTTTTFGPWVKVPVTVIVLLAALWGPVTSVLDAPAPTQASSQPSAALAQVATAVGGGLPVSPQGAAVIAKVSGAVSSGVHSVSLASAVMSWAIHLLLAGVFLYFLWKPGYLTRAVPGRRVTGTAFRAGPPSPGR